MRHLGVGQAPVTTSQTDATEVQWVNVATYQVPTSGTALSTTFVAPRSGRVKITWGGRCDKVTGGTAARFCPEVRDGAVVGSGTVRFTANDDNSIAFVSTSEAFLEKSAILSGLTYNSTYNIRLLGHAGSASSNTSSVSGQWLIIEPA